MRNDLPPRSHQRPVRYRPRVNKYRYLVKRGLFGPHSRLHLFRRVRQLLGEVDELTRSIDVEGVFNTNAYLLFRNIDTRFNGEHGTGHERLVVVIRVVHIDTDGMPERMQEVLAQGLPMEVFAAGVDVV